MEADKENISRLKQTRIPLPLKPLPALPQHLIENKRIEMGKEKNERYPLKTLNLHQNLALPSTSQKVRHIEKPLNIDTKFVTVRNRSENLDWEYKVFKDDDEKRKLVEDDIVITISSDEENSNKNNEYKFFSQNKRRSQLDDEKGPETPTLKKLESNRIKNIKRSLKRPHSRELQGLSPQARQQKNDEKARMRLNFKESLHERLASPDFLKKSYMDCLVRDYVADTFTYLLTVERKTNLPYISSTMRACVINWLMKVHGTDGNPATIQAAVWYLDSVLATGQVQVDKLQLIAAACYWIAHKLYGPGLSATRLVRCSNQAFTASNLLNAEKMILKKLNFPPQPVVPHEYITYLAWWCDKSHPGEIEVAATFICMAGIMVDKSLNNERPSVVGAAAVRNALLLLRKKQLILHLHNCPTSAVLKTSSNDVSHVCSIQRKAVRTISSLNYEYKAPFEQYGTPPFYIAQRIANAAFNLHVTGHYNNINNNTDEEY